MRARGWVVAGVLGWGVGSASAEPKPRPVDIKAFKSKLLVVQDAHGGTYVALNEAASDARLFYGTGKTLYEQVVIGGSRNGDAWTINTWAPRLGETHPAYFAFKADGSYEKTCDGKDDAILSLVGGDQANAILDKYRFVTTATIYVPELLARDDAGVYYYVDRLAKAYGGKGYRVWVGRKGAMKQLALTDIASDTAGKVFSTRKGDLRLVNTHGDAGNQAGTLWVKGGKRTALIKLDVDTNSPVIFSDLGIYKFLGTLCDNI